ncbi:MAG: hypothetical protein AB8B97_27960 [Granulosicoccus sp.]
MSKYKSRECLAVFVLAAVIKPLFGVPAFASTQDDGYALRATLEHRFNPTQQVLGRSRVVFNRDGYRLDALPLEMGQAIIADSLNGHTWFVDTIRSTIHQVPSRVVEDAPTLSEPFISLPGFIDSIACGMQGGLHVGDVTFKGLSLEKWQCTADQFDLDDIDELAVEQYYSRELGIVVFSRSHSNIVSELINLKRIPVDPDIFKAPEGLHNVTIEQFLGQAQPLAQYQQSQIIPTE